jgi:putative spermidine/putrescine transport system ATP-binding protein
MNDVISNCSIKGKVLLDGQNIYSDEIDPVQLRAKVGMVFQKPNPFPKSIFENIAYGPRIHGMGNTRGELNDLVHHSLERAGLIDEVKDRLDDIATGLSGGQQQRTAIARAIAVNPEVILMDEPCSSLDPIATAKIEELMNNLESSKGITVVYVRHDQSEALTMSNRIAVFNDGVVQQLSTPDILYEKPENSFVAKFIGENNTLNGVVKEINGSSCVVDLDNNQGTVKALKINVNGVGEKTQLSIRPERVSINESDNEVNSFSGKIEELIYLGDHIRARLDVCGNNEFIVKVPNEGNFSHKEGDILNLSWNYEESNTKFR